MLAWVDAIGMVVRCLMSAYSNEMLVECLDLM